MGEPTRARAPAGGSCGVLVERVVPAHPEVARRKGQGCCGGGLAAVHSNRQLGGRAHLLGVLVVQLRPRRRDRSGTD